MGQPNQRRTKIVSTLGPATATRDRITELLCAGTDVVRLNFSHGTHDWHRRLIRLVREVAEECGREVGILQDLGGPKIRLGELADGERELVAGQRVVLTPGESAEGDEIPVQYPYLLDDVGQGDRIMLADGFVELHVIAKSSTALQCEVLVGSTIASRKGVNLPGSTLRVPSFTAKDHADLEVGLEEQVDFVALSFVRHEDDLNPVREQIAGSQQQPAVIAKIEKPQALERLPHILERVDGVLVARGDLGVEMPIEQVPLIQKRVIRAAMTAGKPVITATQMLRSMVTSSRPLRAEATDVANAILDGTDAVMLSEETAVGQHPVKAVAMLDSIARTVEPHLEYTQHLQEKTSDTLPLTAAAFSRAACVLAEDIGARAIIASTTSGSTARLIARLRPRALVIGFTPSLTVKRQLTLCWGVAPALATVYPDTDTMFDLALAWAREHEIVAPGDRLVVTAGLPVNVAGTTNLLRVFDVD